MKSRHNQHAKSYSFIADLWQKCSQWVACMAIFLLTFVGIAPQLYAGDTDPGDHGTGARPLTEAQVHKIHAEWPRVLAVKPNKYGAERIQKHLHENEHAPKSFEIAIDPEDEFITNKNIGSDYEADFQITKFGAIGLPPSVDNSKLACFPPIGDQRQEGSCVGWASTYYHATHEYGLLNGINNKSSSNGIRSAKWTYNMINDGVDGGSWPTDAYDLLNKNGAASNNDFPYNSNYTEWDLKTQDWISGLSYRMGPPQYITINGQQDIDTIKQILNNGHIVTFTTYAYSWVYTKVKADPSSSSNPYAGQNAISWMNGESGGHHTTIVGYDDNVWIDVNNNNKVDPGEKGAFLVANSWGTGWANKGFIWISYDAFLKTSAVTNGPNNGRVQVADMLYSIVPKSANYTPKLIAKFSLTQAQRNKLAINAGVSNVDATSPAKKFASAALTRDGGSLAFDGTSAKNLTATFALDLTDLLPSGSSPTNQRYYLISSDLASGNSTTLNSFSLVDLQHNKEVANTKTPLNFDNSTIQPYIDYDFSDNTVEKIPPVVSLTSPVNGATVSGTINVTANATDNVGVTRVEFYVDSTLQSTDSSAPYVLSLDTTKLSNGQHTLTAIAYDAAGNHAQSAVTVKVQNNIFPQGIYINAGNGEVFADGLTWKADTNFSGGTATTISGTFCFTNPIYKSIRYGKKFQYVFDLENGNYLLTLKMAELSYRAAGQRVFNITINGTRVTTNLDLFNVAGFGVAKDFSYRCPISNGRLQVVFESSVGDAQVNGIKITKY